MSATSSLARFAAEGFGAALPKQAVDAVKLSILDTVAVTVAGAREPVSRRVRALGERIGGTPEATVIGTDLRTDVATAALVNGTSGHALDYDDVSFASSAHPSISLLPPLLAVGESSHVSGMSLINAYAVGFQCAVALGRALNPGHYAKGWHGTGTVGCLSATLALASLRGLDEAGASAALAIAVSDASGLRGNFGTDVKPYQVGNAGRAAVTAFLFAELGAVAVDDILERTHGFFALYSSAKSASVADPHDEPMAVLSPGMTTKIFPSCASSHAAVSALLQLREQGLRAEDVESVRIDLTDVALENMKYPRPQTGLEAKFSLQYCIARALVAGTLTLDDFSDEAVAIAPKDLMERISMAHDPELTREYVWGADRPAIVTVQLKTGSVLRQRAEGPVAGPNAVSMELLHAKVRDCLARGRTVGDAEEIIGAVESLDGCSDVTTLTALIASP